MIPPPEEAFPYREGARYNTPPEEAFPSGEGGPGYARAG